MEIKIVTYANGFGTWKAKVTVPPFTDLTTNSARLLASIAIHQELRMRQSGTAIIAVKIVMDSYIQGSDITEMPVNDTWVFSEA